MQQHMRLSHTTLYGITVQVTLDLVRPWAGHPTDISETQYSFISGPHHSGWLLGGKVFQKIVQFLSCGYRPLFDENESFNFINVYEMLDVIPPCGT